MDAAPVTVVAGVDIGNATTEVVVLDGERLLGAGRLPTRGRKGSAESLRGAAALVRRIERRLGTTVDEARIAPLRAVGTATLTIPAVVPDTGRLRVLAAGVATPGGTGTCVGAPLWLDSEGREAGSPGRDRPAGVAPDGRPPDGGPAAWVALVPPGLGYVAAARRLRELLAAGVPVGAVLAGSDEGVLIANRLDAPVPVIDQIDVAAAAGCARLAVEVRPPGQPLTLLTDPVALAAALRLGDGGRDDGGLGDREAGDAATVGRALLDYGNGVVGLASGAVAGAPAPGRAEPWVLAHGRRIGLREACAELAGWPVGTVTALGTPDAQSPRNGQACRNGQASLDDQAHLDDLFAVDLAAAADTDTARRGSVGRAVLVSSLHRLSPGRDHAAVLAGLLGCPVRCVLSEPAAARLGACTTPGARADAIVVDVGAGTIDVIAPDGEVVAAGAGELLTAAVAETLGVPRAAADWVKRGPCVRLDGSQRFEAEDGRRGFLDGPADPAAAGMLAAAGPAGWLPFDRRHSPAEWRAIRLRLKEAVFAANLARALRTLKALGTLDALSTRGTPGRGPGQVLIVGGPAGDDELLGVLLRTLPDGVTAGRGNVGGTLAGPPAGHRHAAALGLALAEPAAVR
ncbi:MAG TPA: diol dehydratase reactivase ATPase-like domain-containing protein [Streptosporangiaceae bacterium]|nr:diol dehydratase reactivase ATPase-like domain-containing protein [Streptosporangiaceae bacterium]